MGIDGLERRVERLEEQNLTSKKHRDLSGLTVDQLTSEELLLLLRKGQLGMSTDLDFTAEELTVLIRWKEQFDETIRRDREAWTPYGEVVRTEPPKLDFNDKELRREIPEAELDARINKAKESLARCMDTVVKEQLSTMERLKALRKRTS